MRVVTIVSLAASAVLGLGALVVAKVMLPNAASARGAASASLAQGQAIVVASREIKYGEKLQASMLTVIKVPKDAVPDGAFTSVAGVLSADQGGPPVALTPIANREPLLPTKVSGPGSRPIVSATIAEGMRAYTLKVDEASGLGGHALPGDHVDVVLSRDLTPEGQQRNMVSYVVVQNARVLGVDLNADPTSEKPAKPDTTTIEVSVEDAQKLSVASTVGILSLALRRNGEAVVNVVRPMRTTDFLTGSAPPKVRMAGPVYRSAPAGPPRPVSAIIIIEGQPTKRPAPSRRPSGPASLTATPVAPTAPSAS